MDETTLEFLRTLIATLIGGMIVIGAELIRGRYTRKFERDTFQRINLLETQEKLAEWSLAWWKSFHFDRDSLIASGEITKSPPEIEAELFETNRQLSYRIARISDPKLRKSLSDLMASTMMNAVGLLESLDSVTSQSIDEVLKIFETQLNMTNDILDQTLRKFL